MLHRPSICPRINYHSHNHSTNNRTKGKDAIVRGSRDVGCYIKMYISIVGHLHVRAKTGSHLDRVLFTKSNHTSSFIFERNQTMPTFLFHGTYVNKGVEGLMKEGGTARKEMIRQLIESLGGTCECVYFGLDTDAYAIAHMPNDAAAASFNLTCNASGKLNVTATLLLSPEQMDEATQVKPDYRPPGE